MIISYCSKPRQGSSRDILAPDGAEMLAVVEPGL